MKLRVRSVLALFVFLKWILPNVFSTLQSKLGGDLTFSLLCRHGHLKIIIYLFKPISFPALTAFHSCSIDHLSQSTVPTTVARIAGLKVPAPVTQWVMLLRSCSLFKARQMETSEEDFFQQKKHKGTCRTTKPVKQMGQCPQLLESFIASRVTSHLRQGLPTYSDALHDIEWLHG